MDHNYWIKTADEKETITYKRLLGAGGYGEVHEVRCDEGIV